MSSRETRQRDEYRGIGSGKLNHFESYEGREDRVYNLAHPRNQKYAVDGGYASPHLKKPSDKPNRFERIKSLKGMVSSIILEKKLQDKNVTQEFDTLRHYQREILDQFSSDRRTENPFTNFNPSSTPRTYQSQKYPHENPHRPKTYQARIQNIEPQIRKQYQNVQRDQKQLNFNKKLRTIQNQQSNSLKPPPFKPTHKRKQSSELFIERPYSAQQENELLKEQNFNLKQELKKSKAFIRLLQQEVEELNQHIKILEKANLASEENYSSYHFQEQLRHKNINSQISSKRRKRDSSEQLIEMRRLLKYSKQENQCLRLNIMKLLNSKLEPIYPPLNPKNSPTQPNSEYISIVKETAAPREKTQHNQLSEKKDSNSSTIYKYQSSFQTPLGSTPGDRKPKTAQQETNWKKECPMYQMANLLNQRVESEDQNISKQISYFQS